MLPRRRYLTFSLRTAFVVMTALAVWLGVIVNRAREQREAIDAIVEIGGTVTFDWHGDPFDRASEIRAPTGPLWLRRLIGDDFFQEATVVTFNRKAVVPDSDILKSTPDLRRLRKLKVVVVPSSVSPETLARLEAALPTCETFNTARPLWFAD